MITIKGKKKTGIKAEKTEKSSTGIGPSCRPKTKSKKIKVSSADTNVLLLSMKKLEDESDIATGDSVHCEKCQAVLSCVSSITQQEQTTIWVWLVLHGICNLCRIESSIGLIRRMTSI